MPNLSYSVSDFLPFTKIVSADVNSRFTDIKTLLNTTKLDSTNIQLNGLTRDRLALGTANQVVINDGTGLFSGEAQLAVSRGGTGQDFSGSLAANAGAAVVVNGAGNALTLGSPLQSTLTESFSGVVSTLTAGAAITVGPPSAVAIDTGVDVSGNTCYRVFNADYTLPNRRKSFLGFAQAAATVTAGVYTWTASANFVTSNVITYVINGRSYSTNFTTDNATTLQAVATQMATDPDVSGAVSNGVHVVTVTGKGGLTIYISGSVVTAGASQATITFATTVVASGQNVLIQCFGPLAGFTGLTVGAQYYINTGGTISTAQNDSSLTPVGQAISSTVLFICNNSLFYQFSTSAIFVRSHGSGTNAFGGVLQDVEHWNYASWAAGTSSSAGGRGGTAAGDRSYNGFLHQLDGITTGSSAGSLFQRYSKAAWATLTNRPTPSGLTTAYAYNGFFWASRDTSQVVDFWNGAAWATNTNTTGNFFNGNGIFVQGGLLHFFGATSNHGAVNSSGVWSTLTVAPVNTVPVGASSTSAAAGYYVDGLTTNSYRWNGSWGGAVTVTYAPQGTSSYGGASGYNSVNTLATVNGGSTASVAISTTAQYNDVTWASATSSTNPRAGATGGVF